MTDYLHCYENDKCTAYLYRQSADKSFITITVDLHVATIHDTQARQRLAERFIGFIGSAFSSHVKRRRLTIECAPNSRTDRIVQSERTHNRAGNVSLCNTNRVQTTSPHNHLVLNVQLLLDNSKPFAFQRTRCITIVIRVNELLLVATVCIRQVARRMCELEQNSFGSSPGASFPAPRVAECLSFWRNLAFALQLLVGEGVCVPADGPPLGVLAFNERHTFKRSEQVLVLALLRVRVVDGARVAQQLLPATGNKFLSKNNRYKGHITYKTLPSNRKVN